MSDSKHNFNVLQQCQADVLLAFAKYDSGKMSAAAFSNLLASFGLHITGSFNIQLQNRQLTRANLFRSLLRPTLTAVPTDSHVAGVAVKFDEASTDTLIGGHHEDLSKAQSSNTYWHAAMYSHSSGNGDLVDDSVSVAASEFAQFPTHDIAPEVHEALKVFCEEQIDGARLRRCLHHDCGIQLSDEQVHVINRQEVSGRRNLQRLLMVFAPRRPIREGFSKIDSAPAFERQKALAEADFRKASPPPAGAKINSFDNIRAMSHRGTGDDMLRFDEHLPLQEHRRQLGSAFVPTNQTFDPTIWVDSSQPHAATVGGVRTGIPVAAAGHHGDIFTWEGNEPASPARASGKLIVPGAATLSGVQTGNLVPEASRSLDIRHEFGSKGSAAPELRGTRPGQESAQDLVTKNSYPARPTSAMSSRSHLEPTPADCKRVRNVGPKPAQAVINADVHSFAVRNFPLDTAKGIRPGSAARASTAQTAPWGTDDNVDSPAYRNIAKPRAGEMTPTRIYEALSSNMRRLGV